MNVSTTPDIVRVVVDGWTYWRGQLDNTEEARAMLLTAFASDSWPADPATFTVTPGGFVRACLPVDFDGGRGWDSRDVDLAKLLPSAEAAVDAVVQGEVIARARARTRFLTLARISHQCDE